MENVARGGEVGKIKVVKNNGGWGEGAEEGR